MNVGVNYMREHMPSDARIHYAMLDSGGIAPILSAGFTKKCAARPCHGGSREVWMLVRPMSLRVADGAALMTETRVEVSVTSGVSNLLGNTPLEKAMQSQLERNKAASILDA